MPKLTRIVLLTPSHRCILVLHSPCFHSFFTVLPLPWTQPNICIRRLEFVSFKPCFLSAFPIFSTFFFIVDHCLQYKISLTWQASSCWSSDLGLVLRSHFTVGLRLIQCITGSEKVNYRAEERKMCALQKMAPVWVLNWSAVNKTIISVSFPWLFHFCFLSYSGSSTVEYETLFYCRERLWPAFKNFISVFRFSI